MAVAVLPFIPSEAHYTFDTSILDTPYSFEVRWNARDPAWYFDLSEIDGTPILRGVKIVLGTYLGRTSTHILFQNGVFAVIDTSGGYRDPGFDDLGTRVEVRFYPTADIINELYAV